MGYYVQAPSNKGKAEYLAENFERSRLATLSEARDAMENGEGVIVVVDNGPFEAAGFCYDVHEFNAFTDPSDSRPKKYVVMDYDLAADLSGYRRR